MNIKQILTKRTWHKFHHVSICKLPDWLIDGIRICRIINRKAI